MRHISDTKLNKNVLYKLKMFDNQFLLFQYSINKNVSFDYLKIKKNLSTKYKTLLSPFYHWFNFIILCQIII